MGLNFPLPNGYFKDISNLTNDDGLLAGLNKLASGVLREATAASGSTLGTSGSVTTMSLTDASSPNVGDRTPAKVSSPP